MGEGPGFRKVRRELGVTAFGINAVVLPEGYSTGVHYHDEQEETYFVHRGRVEFRFGDGTVHVVGTGDEYTLEMRMDYADGREWFLVAVLTLKDGLVHRQRTYFAERFPAPAWRADLVETLA